MKNPFAAPDPHLMAQAVVAMAKSMGATVVGWKHICGTELLITTGDGNDRSTWTTSRYTWSSERGDWVRAVPA